MEVRCGSCNKLFRVSDDKITGSGIRFTCTRCGSFVKITREDLEQYSMSRQAAVMSAAAPAPPSAPSAVPPAVPPIEPAIIPADDRIDEFDLSSPAEAAAAQQKETQPKPAEKPVQQQTVPVRETEPGKVQPEAPVPPTPSPAAQAKPASLKTEPAQIRPAPKPAPQAPKPEVKTSPRPQHESVPAAASRAPQSSPAAAGAVRPSRSTRSNKLLVVVIVAVILLGAAAFAVKNYYMPGSSGHADSGGNVSTPDGLQIQNAAGSIDPVQKDLIVTGVVENTTGDQKPAWYIVVDVYDAQGSVIATGKFVNGKQYYSRRDYEVLAGRGVDIQELKTRNLQAQGVIIPPKGSVPFEIRILDPPIGIASFNASLQPFDPVQLYKQMTEEQK